MWHLYQVVVKDSNAVLINFMSWQPRGDEKQIYLLNGYLHVLLATRYRLSSETSKSIPVAS